MVVKLFPGGGDSSHVCRMQNWLRIRTKKLSVCPWVMPHSNCWCPYLDTEGSGLNLLLSNFAPWIFPQKWQRRKVWRLPHLLYQNSSIFTIFDFRSGFCKNSVGQEFPILKKVCKQLVWIIFETSFNPNHLWANVSKCCNGWCSREFLTWHPYLDLLQWVYMVESCVSGQGAGS